MYGGDELWVKEEGRSNMFIKLLSIARIENSSRECEKDFQFWIWTKFIWKLISQIQAHTFLLALQPGRVQSSQLASY